MQFGRIVSTGPQPMPLYVANCLALSQQAKILQLLGTESSAQGFVLQSEEAYRMDDLFD